MFKNLAELRDWHITQIAKYSRLSEINRSAASDKRNELIAKKLERCAQGQDAHVAVHEVAVRVLSAEKSKPDSWYDVDVIDALVRRLDVIINGEKGAARQAMLCDLVAQLEVEELPAVAVPDECSASGESCVYETVRNREQCKYCGKPSVEQPDSAAPKQIEISDIVSIPCTHCGNKVNFAQPKPQRITEQDAREIAWDAVFSIGEKYGRDLHEAINRWWEWEGTGRTLLAKLNEHREPDTRSREIPVNDPIFYFVAQHYPMTAQHIERIYRECAHHYERREVNHVK